MPRAQPSSASRIVALVAMAFVCALGLAACGVSYPDCAGDNDCRSHHEVCVNRHCQQCRQTTECGSNHTCLHNRCLTGVNVCDADGDCTATQRCADHHCGPRAECDDTHACPSSRPCVAGQCAAASGNPDDDDPHDNHGRLCTFNPIYFGYDTYQLDDASRHALQSAADCLARETGSRYVLIGRSDPRGSAEYNLALGERRARIAQHYLMSLGVAEQRVEVSSEGSEGAAGTDDASWARDRRVDFRPRN